MMTAWELFGVFTSIAYLILAMRENRWCFVLGFLGSVVFTLLFLQTKLYMESGLQAYYALMSVYGWHQWQANGNENKSLEISHWPFKTHFYALSLIFGLSILSAVFLSKTTEAAYPFFDSVVTWGSLVTTYMVTRKILENWLYWVVLDSLALCLYFNKALYLTVGLFAAYVLLALLGHFRWLNKYQMQGAEASAPVA